MKKLLLFLFVVGVNIHLVQAQLFGKSKAQVEANDKQAFVYDYLVSDTLIYKSMMLRDPSMTVVMMHDIYGNAMYVIVQRDNIDTINNAISKFTSNQNAIWGLGFNLTYLEDFSYQSNKKIKNIKDPYQKNMTKTFNKKVKYILMQQSPRAVRGKRVTDTKNSNYGKIIPDFDSVENPRDPETVTEPVDTLQKVTPRFEKRAELALPVYIPPSSGNQKKTTTPKAPSLKEAIENRKGN